MKIINYLFLLLFLFLNLLHNFSHAQVRIKDLVSIKGVRENPVLGYGLVIGSENMEKWLEKLKLNGYTYERCY